MDATINIIFEDDNILVLNKPAGVPVYPAKKGKEKTVLSSISAKWPGATPVHRLDNDTSGCLLVAKNRPSYENLRRQFDEGKILKRYIALVLGETPPEGIIEVPIIHDPRNKKKMKCLNVVQRSFKSCSKACPACPPKQWWRERGLASRRVVPKLPCKNAQEAHTEYKLFKKYLGGQYSLLEVTIKTGVRHQIRVHLASNGHPLAGDLLYQTTRQHQRDNTGLPHHFLHATGLGFYHPQNGKRLEFTSNLPADLQNVLTKLVVA